MKTNGLDGAPAVLGFRELATFSKSPNSASDGKRGKRVESDGGGDGV